MLRRPIRARGHGYENSACVDRLDKDSSNQGQVLLVGGRTAPPVVGGVGRELKRGLVLESLDVRRVGDDLFIEADVRRP